MRNRVTTEAETGPQKARPKPKFPAPRSGSESSYTTRPGECCSALENLRAALHSFPHRPCSHCMGASAWRLATTQAMRPPSTGLCVARWRTRPTRDPPTESAGVASTQQLARVVQRKEPKTRRVSLLIYQHRDLGG